MYGCVCVCVCVCEYMWTPVRMCIDVYVRLCVRVCTHVCMDMYVCYACSMPICMCLSVCTNVYTYRYDPVNPISNANVTTNTTGVSKIVEYACLCV